jgi:uncharacterized membrane protein
MVWDCGRENVITLNFVIYILMQLLEQMDLDFTPLPERGLVKIPQIGNVIIGNNVEIGANSCVDH